MFSNEFDYRCGDEVNLGTKVTANIPFKVSSVDSLPEERVKVNNFHGYQVLIVDDNEINQEVAASMMEIFGAGPFLASNGKEALDMLEERTFDLVFMDMDMPVLDGIEVTKQIRNTNKSYSRIPIIAMTGSTMKDEVNQCTDAGMNGHISKPLEIKNVGAVLEHYLDSRQ